MDAAGPKGVQCPGQAGRRVDVSVVFPCLNEARTVGACVREAWHAIHEAGLAGEVVVADNGSTDGSREAAEKAGARVVPVEVRGYGAAIAGGVNAAVGGIIVMADADGSYPLAPMGRMVSAVRAGAGLVMGCRMPSGGGQIAPGAMPWQNRWIGNPALSGIGRFLFGVRVRDFHCGIRAFTPEAWRAMDLRALGMELATEMVVKAAQAGLKIAEVPVSLRPDGRGRRPHLRPWRDGWRHLRLMLLLSPRWLFDAPGWLLLGGGLAVCLALLPGPVRFMGVRFDINTLLAGATFALLGLQVLVFGWVARVFTTTEGLLAPSRREGGGNGRRPMETGLGLGLALGVLGFALLVWETLEWVQTGFGDLAPSESIRRVGSAVNLMAAGCVIVFGGFCVGVISLPRWRERVFEPPPGRGK